MTTPPRVSPDQIEAALARISRRRIELDDPHWSDVDQESPDKVLDHILDHPIRGHQEYAKADVNDGQVLRRWLWWKDCQRDLKLLKRGMDVGMSRAELGKQRGIGSQGVQDRIDAYEALLERGRPDAKTMRLKRSVAREAPTVGQPRTRWLIRNHDWLTEVATNLVQHANQIADDDAYAVLLEVKRDLRDDEWSPSSLTMMSLTVEYLRAQPEVIGLAGQHLLKRACGAVDDIHIAFTNLTDRPKAKRKAATTKKKARKKTVPKTPKKRKTLTA